MRFYTLEKSSYGVQNGFDTAWNGAVGAKCILYVGNPNQAPDIIVSHVYHLRMPNRNISDDDHSQATIFDTSGTPRSFFYAPKPTSIGHIATSCTIHIVDDNRAGRRAVLLNSPSTNYSSKGKSHLYPRHLPEIFNPPWIDHSISAMWPCGDLRYCSKQHTKWITGLGVSPPSLALSIWVEILAYFILPFY